MLRRTLIVGLAALSLGLVACGDDDADSAAAPPAGAGAVGGGLTIKADPGGRLAYETTDVTAPAGPGKLTFVNDAPVPHDVVIARDGEDVAATEEITEDTQSIDIDLDSGSYTFYCSVDSHRAAGMEGTLTVK